MVEKPILCVPSNVFKPSNYADVFCEILDRLDLQGKSVLDLGCGCGVLGIFAALRGAKVTFCDLHEKSVLATKANCEKNGIVAVDYLVGDSMSVFDGSSQNNTFDLIVCNHPSVILGEFNNQNGSRVFLDSVLTSCVNYLNLEGKILTHTSAEQNWNETLSVMPKSGLHNYDILRVESLELTGDYYLPVIETWKKQPWIKFLNGVFSRDVVFFTAGR